MTLRILEFEAKRRQERCVMRLSFLEDQAKKYGASSKDPERTEKEFLYKFKVIRSTFKNEDDVLKATESVRDRLSNSNSYNELPIKQMETQTILDLL